VNGLSHPQHVVAAGQVDVGQVFGHGLGKRLLHGELQALQLVHGAAELVGAHDAVCQRVEAAFPFGDQFAEFFHGIVGLGSFAHEALDTCCRLVKVV
jgi:hypothetical protein